MSDKASKTQNLPNVNLALVTQVLETLGFESQPKDVFGSPAFAHKEQMVAVFLDVCSLHGCPEHCRPVTSDQTKKVAATKHRDAGARTLLEGSGWRVIRIWEHDLDGLTPDKSPLRF